MKLVREHMNESIKHLKPRSEEEVEKYKKGDLDKINNYLKNKGEAWYIYINANQNILNELASIVGIKIMTDNFESILSKMRECFIDSIDLKLE